MKAKLTMITLGVADLAASTAFYKRLGLERNQGPATITFIEMGGVVLALFPRGKLAEDIGVASEGTGFRGVSLAHNVASESEVDAVLAEAVAAGAILVKAGTKAPWGGYSGYFADPDGHYWEVAFNPLGF